MTPADIATIIALAAVGGWAYWNARRMAQTEAEVIAENIEQGFDEDLPHDELVWWRIEWVGSGWIAAWMILAAVLLLGLDGSWRVALSVGVPLACVAWAVFTLAHRYTLNRARGKDWRYTAPGNRYDWMFIRHTLGWINRNNYREHVRDDHAMNYGSLASPDYTKAIHRAGLMAYAFEALVLVAAVTVALWIA